VGTALQVYRGFDVSTVLFQETAVETQQQQPPQLQKSLAGEAWHCSEHGTFVARILGRACMHDFSMI
jgi:hypothetical protein